jgi:hypothetical protein
MAAVRIPSDFRINLGDLLDVHFGVWEREWDVNTDHHTTIVHYGREYGLEIRMGERREWNWTRRHTHRTRTINWK